jgi:hypothetical protein
MHCGVEVTESSTNKQHHLRDLSPLVSAQACHMAKRRVGVEYSPSLLEPVRPGAVLPDRPLCLPTFSHFLIVNQTSLSLTHTHTHSLTLTLTL